MVSLFTVAGDDQSVAYLSQLFGYMGGVLPTGSVTIFGTMFKTLNTTALVLGSIIVVHTIIMGLLKTAQEGEFLGKQWNSLWVPLRTVMGIAALFPTASGYSILQVIMMWFIVQGIGAADTLWTTVLTYVANIGSPYATGAGPGSPGMQIQQNMGNLFNALVCQAEAHSNYSDTYTPTGATTAANLYFCADPNNGSNPFCQASAQDILNVADTSLPSHQVTISNGMVNYTMGPNGSCGSMSYPDVNTYVNPKSTGSTNTSGVYVPNNTPVCKLADTGSLIACAGIKQVQPSIQAVVTTLGGYASLFAGMDNIYLEFYNGANGQPTNVTWIQNYCAAVNIPQQSCCLKSIGSLFNSGLQGIQLINALIGFLEAPCLMVGLPQMPSPYNTVASQTEYTNASQGKNGVTQLIYWPFAMASILGGSNDMVGAATNEYMGNIQAAIVAATLAHAQALSGWEASASDTGWLFAGAYYYKLAGMGNSIQTAKLPTFIVNATDPLHDGQNSMNAYRNNFEGADDMMNSSSAQAANSSGPPQFAQMGTAMNSGASGIVNNFMQELSGSKGGNQVTNPLVDAQGFGESLLITAQVIYPVTLAVVMVLLVVSNITFMGLGTGVPTNPASTAVQFISYAAFSIVMAFCGWCVTFGSMLGIYTPLIPYILFVFGSLGWFISTLEAMVAAPFVALGILSPGGQHEILGRAEPALMILLNIFLRPSLMIFGMMGGMLLAPVAVSMLNDTFQGVMGSINSTPGIIELIVFISAYATLVVTVMNKCFALINIIPDRVLTWIGGQAGSSASDAGEGLGAAQKGTEGAAGAAKGGMEAGKGSADSLNKENMEERGKAAKASSGKKKAADAKAAAKGKPKP